MDKDSRRDDLLERHNTKAVETGVRLQGEFFLRALHQLDEIDSDWAEQWLKWIYEFQYNRGVLDDKTRVLIIIGECVVAGHVAQLANHMRTALEAGAKPEEIVEVLFQGSIYAGMPAFFRALLIYRDLMNDLGLAHYTEPPFQGDARDKR